MITAAWPPSQPLVPCLTSNSNIPPSVTTTGTRPPVPAPESRQYQNYFTSPTAAPLWQPLNHVNCPEWPIKEMQSRRIQLRSERRCPDISPATPAGQSDDIVLRIGHRDLTQLKIFPLIISLFHENYHERLFLMTILVQSVQEIHINSSGPAGLLGQPGQGHGDPEAGRHDAPHLLSLLAGEWGWSSQSDDLHRCLPKYRECCCKAKWENETFANTKLPEIATKKNETKVFQNWSCFLATKAVTKQIR